MFNGQFGKQRFSLNVSEEMEIAVTASFSDSLKNVSGFGLKIIIEENLFDSLNERVRITPTIPVKSVVKDSLMQRSDIYTGMIVKEKYYEEMSNRSSAVVFPAIKELFEDKFESDVYLGKNIDIKSGVIYGKEELGCIPTVYKDVKITYLATDNLYCKAYSTVLDEETMFISVSIPSGGVLEIDSDTFDVFLNGENVLNLHDGSWLFLDREVVSISIDTGTGGGLEGSLLYEERYL